MANKMSDESKRFSFEIFKWPINILAFELAFGYGFMRLLSAYYGSGEVPVYAQIVSLGIICSLCLFVVISYMPDDTDFFHFKSDIPLYVWISLTHFLAVGVPFISVMFDGTVFFWACALISAAIKVLYELEELRRKKHTGYRAPTSEEIAARRRELYGRSVNVQQPEKKSRIYDHKFLTGYVYKSQPDAFALQRPITLLFLILFGLGLIALILGATNKSAGQIFTGLFILTVTNIAYVSLSGASRVHAIRSWRREQSKE